MNKFVELYDSYKQGYQAGSNGYPITALIGTPEPLNLGEFNLGYEDGLTDFNARMKAAQERLQAKVN